MGVSPLRALTLIEVFVVGLQKRGRNGSKPVEGIDTLSCSSMPGWVKRDAIRKEEIHILPICWQEVNGNEFETSEKK